MLFKFFEKSVPCYPATSLRCRLGVSGLRVGLRARRARLCGGDGQGCPALIAVYEALLFAVLGRVVDWIAAATPATLWAERGNTLTWIAAVMVASIALVALRTSVSTRR